MISLTKMALDIKAKIRREYLVRRNSLAWHQVNEWSKIIQNKVINSVEFESASIVGSYFPINSEVLTQNIIEAALGRKRVGLPKVVDQEIRIYEIARVAWLNQLQPGKYGIKEPINCVDISELITLLIVPGIVFDTSGCRLGYGKGYYDRFISYLKRVGNPLLTIGLAFDFQLIEKSMLPCTEQDERMDMIITDRRTIKGMISNS
ncbi:MAG TPA: 5-formyltetrahydrofolate cyclo-ligase [Nitrososphaeraceae archaeon]